MNITTTARQEERQQTVRCLKELEQSNLRQYFRLINSWNLYDAKLQFVDFND